MRPAAEFLAEIVRDAADVSSLCAGDAKLPERLGIIRETKIVDVDQARLALHLDAFAREFVKRHAVHFDGRNHWRHLHLVADELGGFFIQHFERHRRNSFCFENFAVRVIAVRRLAEFYRAFINLVIAHQFFRELRAATEDDDEQAGGVRIKRAAVADLFDLKTPADCVHDIVRRRAGGFINEDRAVECGKFLHGTSLSGFQRLLDRGDDLALNRKRRAGNARARRRQVAAAAELRRDFVHVHIGIFRAQADAREFRFNLLKHAGDHDRLDGADVVNQAFGVVAVRAGAGEILFLQPEPRDAVVVRQPEFAVDVLEQFRARDRIRLINLVANFGEVRAARDEFRSGVKRAGPRGRVLKRAGVGGNGGEQQIVDRLGDRPARDLEQAVNQFAGGRLARRNPVHIGIARVAFVMVNVDENFPVADAFANLAEPLEAGAVGGDDAVEFFAALRFFNQPVAGEKFIFQRDGVLVPDGDVFAFVLQRERQSELRTDAVAVRPDMADDAKGLVFADDFENPVYDFGIIFHGSNSIIRWRRTFFQFLDDLQHLVAAHDGIINDKFQRGREFQDDGPANQPLDADAMLVEQMESALLLFGVAEDADEDDGGFQIAAHVHVVDGNEAGLVDVKLAADSLADLALQKLAHALMSQVVHKSKWIAGLLDDWIIER